MSTILIGGGTGLVGLRLSALLVEKGHTVRHLSRKGNLSAPYPAYAWNVQKRTLDAAALEGVDVIVNLAGAGIADERWSASRKKEIIDSRIDSTATIEAAIRSMEVPPKVFVSASAIGIYGDRGDEWLHETSEIGNEQDFMVETCKKWEDAAQDVKAATNIRTVLLRIGIVLSTKGGALEKMILPTRLGVAGYFGAGKQWYSWIHIEDLCKMVVFSIENSIEGVYNAVAPEAVTIKTLASELKDALGVWALVMPVPSIALRLGMGEMADVVLNSTRVSADKIIKAGYTFDFKSVQPALKDVISRKI